MNGLLAPAWQVLQALVSWSNATVNLALLLAPTAFSSPSIAGPMMVLIISAKGMPSWVGNCFWASSRHCECSSGVIPLSEVSLKFTFVLSEERVPCGYLDEILQSEQY
jgi:hypothetical protein